MREGDHYYEKANWYQQLIIMEKKEKLKQEVDKIALALELETK